MHIYW